MTTEVTTATIIKHEKDSTIYHVILIIVHS